jgi:ABC-type antimicrobial peptide transport system permease subunit
VIGVVKDVKYTGLRDGAEPVVWVPYPQGKMHWNWGPQWLVVQSAGDPLALASPIRRALRAADATLPLTDVMTLRERMSFVMRGPRFTTSLMSLFAAAALLLGSIGLYGVMAYAVSQETRAIGIRLALGAPGGDILRLVLGRGLILVAMGIGIGLVVAMLLARTLASHLFGVGAMDPLTYGGVALLLAVVAMIASYLPARRATRVDPVVALRMD